MSEFSESMEGLSPIQSSSPIEPKRRRPIHQADSQQDSSSKTVLTSPAEVIHFANEDKSYNEPEDNSTRIEHEEQDNDDDFGEGPEWDDTGNKQLICSAEQESDRRKDSQYLTKPSAPEKVKQTSKYDIKIVLAIVISIAVAISMCGFVFEKETAVRQDCKKFLQLHSKYPNMEGMLWATLIVGVERALNDPGEPATFIFLYNSSSVGQSLLKDVIHITMECFGSSDAIWRTGNDFKSVEITQNYGQVLSRYREELNSKGILVVRDLDQVPPKAAQVFFTICDSYEPLVRNAVVFFTIDISQRITHQKLSPTSIAEGILKDLWREELHSNVLDPLLVRLTENVLKID